MENELSLISNDTSSYYLKQTHGQSMNETRKQWSNRMDGPEDMLQIPLKQETAAVPTRRDSDPTYIFSRENESMTIREELE